jgi:NAD(P)-dependent dehydrogenase (short-subunit alcohol dehydrogenase family)
VPTVFITGANRGIGLALTRQYLQAGWQVVETCRCPLAATALTTVMSSAADRAQIHALDVTDFARIGELAGLLAGQPIDLLINNAGIDAQMRGRFGETAVSSWERTLLVNTIAPLKLMEALAESVRRSERRTSPKINPAAAMVIGRVKPR